MGCTVMIDNEAYSNIFHEIKNSITLISSSLQLIANKHPEVDRFNYWNETMSEVDFLKNMVVQLSSARLGSRLNLTKVNFNSYAQQTLSPAHTFSSDVFQCHLSVDEDIPLIELDTQLIKQALLNLIKNAYEAMQGTGIVNVHVTFIDNQLLISIIDTGGGLDPAIADKIFDPFITSKNGGSGLGLSITKKIIESHHGTLTYQSRPGDGCTFTIALPPTQN